MVLLKHFTISQQVTFRDLVDIIYTEYNIRQKFPYIFNNLGKDYILNTLLYHGLVSLEDCAMFKKKGYSEDLLIENIAYKLRLKFCDVKGLFPDLINCYLVAIVINSDFDMKERYFKTDMYLIGALDKKLYDDDNLFRYELYEQNYKPLTNEQWELLNILHF